MVFDSGRDGLDGGYRLLCLAVVETMYMVVLAVTMVLVEFGWWRQ